MGIFKNKNKTKITKSDEDINDKPRRHYGKRVAFISIIAVIVAAAIVIPNLLSLGAGPDMSAVTVNEEVLSATAATQTITTNLTASGSLEAGSSEDITVAGDITVDEYLVSNGDVVSAGDAIATVDKSSVMSAIEEVQNQMALVDSRLDEINSSDNETTIEASSDCRVKVIYAQEGDVATNVISSDGSLMLLSLDGLMACDIEKTDGVTVGQSVIVTLSDGTTLDGKIATVTDQIATVTISDENADYGDTVTVTSSSGDSLGTSTLYIHSELKVVASSGSVEDIDVSEDDEVSEGDTLLTLSDIRYSGEYSNLMYKRATLESQMEKLFEIYQSGQVTATCDGEISGIDESDDEEETTTTESTTKEIATVKRVNNPTGEDDTGYTNNGGTVSRVTYGGITILTSQTALGALDYTNLSGVDTTQFTVSTVITPDVSVPVYSYSSDSSSWVSGTVSDITAGDLLILTYKADGSLVWIIRVPSTTSASSSSGNANSGSAPSSATSQSSTETGSMNNYSGMMGTGSAYTGNSSETSSTSSVTGTMTGTMTGSLDASSYMQAGSADTATTTTTTVNTYTVDETVIASVTNTEKMSLTLTIDELDIMQFSVGDLVTVSLDAVKGESYDGSITSINTEGTNEGGDTKYEMTVSVARTDDMLVGMNATVYVDLDSVDAICVPAQALTESGNSTICYTTYDAETDTLGGETAVTTGISDGANVEITSGLDDGTTVYYRYADGLVYSFVNAQ